MSLITLTKENLETITGGALPLPRVPQRGFNGAIVGGQRLPGRLIRTKQVGSNGAIIGGEVIWCPFCN